MNRYAAKMMHFLGAAFIAALLTAACQQQEPPTEAPSTPDAQAVQEPTPTDEAPQVVFEPAYPEEVSSEALNQDDVTQQTTSHSHGDDEHSHGPDEAHVEEHDLEEHDSEEHSHEEGLSHEEGHSHEESHSHDSGDGGDHDHSG